jgi:hypothetical protein
MEMERKLVRFKKFQIECFSPSKLKLKQGFLLELENPVKDFSFFKLIVLTVILTQPAYYMNKLKSKDPSEMYGRAKGLMFYQYYDWILQDI